MMSWLKSSVIIRYRQYVRVFIVRVFIVSSGDGHYYYDKYGKEVLYEFRNG